jgi:hypothetical protein
MMTLDNPTALVMLMRVADALVAQDEARKTLEGLIRFIMVTVIPDELQINTYGDGREVKLMAKKVAKKKGGKKGK